MVTSTPCPVWSTAASVELADGATGKLVDSPRTAGKYFVSGTAEGMLKSRDARFRAKLTSWIVEKRRYGEPIPEITSTIIREVRQRRHLSVWERADRTLSYIRDKTLFVGHQVELLANRSHLDEADSALRNGRNITDRLVQRYYTTLNVLAYSESMTFREAEFLLDYLRSQSWIAYKYMGECALTVEGYARLAEIETQRTESSRAFVAMWFDKSLEEAWKHGIEAGVKDAGYDAIRIDRREHINKIDDEIIAEIRRARFLVADFTHGHGGPRGGVYYEAGFAHGLNIPVIFSCRDDVIDDIHFDTRQYNHIVWRDVQELREMLTKRICAVIGDGPHRDLS